MAAKTFRDRADAGRILAGLLDDYRDRDDVVILALPRGGVPVGYEVAIRLHAPLEPFMVRKLGVPNYPEVAMGAIATGGVQVLNDDVLRAEDIDPLEVARVAETEGRELRRREDTYRAGRPMTAVTGKTVIVVDDGLATGATMRAALIALRHLAPACIVVAVPAAPQSSCDELTEMVDEVVCATTPSPFRAVGASYWDFDQTSDEQVRELLQAVHTGIAPDEDSSTVEGVVTTRGGAPPDEVLFDLVGEAQFVLIGEASHGTHEFYSARAAMTRRLIEGKGFDAVVVEADWPDAYRVNRYVRGQGDDDAMAQEALRGFERFPTWMWRNDVVVEFVEWLRGHNEAAEEPNQVGFYGMDLYSLYRSAEHVIAYLDEIDPDAAQRARTRYGCFDQHADNAQGYGYAAAFGAGVSCEEQVVAQLVDLQRHAGEHARRDGMRAGDEQFFAEQNARLVQAAEQYYRTMFSGRISSWNLRDRHMVETVEALTEYLGHHRGHPPKLVIWAHNSHLGDARATEMSASGEFNVGQLMREKYGSRCRSIGFTTFGGTVTAADHWDGPTRRKQVRPGLPGSIEALFHEVGHPEFLVRFDDTGAPATDALGSALLQRAIGVIYLPDAERHSHYFRARAADQFDALIHLDTTTAVRPLEYSPQWHTEEPPPTYPDAL